MPPPVHTNTKNDNVLNTPNEVVSYNTIKFISPNAFCHTSYPRPYHKATNIEYRKNTLAQIPI